jgi:predicted RNase H-like HicB family nuclease
MIKATYDAAICGVPGNYGVVFPDFMGCVSAGDSLEEAERMAHEALQFHIEGMAEDNETIPEPRRHTIEKVANQFDDPDGPIEETWVTIIPVTVNVPQDDDVVQLDVPLSLAKDLDKAGVDRRSFIIEATRRELLRLKKSA